MKTFIQTDDGYIWEDVTDRIESLDIDTQRYVLYSDGSKSLLSTYQSMVDSILDGNRIVIETNLTLIPKNLRVC